jgi:hypothetical protein
MKPLAQLQQSFKTTATCHHTAVAIAASDTATANTARGRCLHWGLPLPALLAVLATSTQHTTRIEPPCESD